jgi:hypothetical protein
MKQYGHQGETERVHPHCFSTPDTSFGTNPQPAVTLDSIRQRRANHRDTEAQRRKHREENGTHSKRPRESRSLETSGTNARPLLFS